MARLQVVLPVCPTCGHVGKIPAQQSLKGYCTGALEKGTSHVKARMIPVTFRGQAPEVEKAGWS